MPSSIIGGRLPNGKYKEVSLDASGRLECSVNEIEITATSLNVKTANVENLLNGGLPSALTGSGNLKVCLQELGNEGSERLNVDIGNDITDVLPTALTGAGNLKVSIQEQHGVNLATSTLQGAGLPAALSGSGNLKVSVEEGSGGDASAANQATMITDLGAIKSSLQSLDDIVQGEDAVHGNAHKGVMSLAVRQDTQASFGGDGDYCPMSIDANGELRVKNITGFSTATLQGGGLPAALTGSGNLKVSIEENAFDGAVTNAGLTELAAAINSNKVDCNIVSGNISGFATSALQTTMESSLDSILAKNTEIESSCNSLISANHTDLLAIDGSINTIEACVNGSNQVNVNIAGGGFDGAVTNAGLTELAAAINSDRVDVNIANGGFDGAVTNAGLTELAAAINSNKVDCNIVSGNITGFATSTLQGTINTSLGTLETSLTSMENKQDTQVNHLSEIEGAVETLEACVNGSNQVKTVNTQNTAGGVWLNSVAVNSTSFSASLETTGFSKLRLFGDVDSDFAGAPPNIIVTGAQTNGGTYTPLANSTDGIDTQSAFISGGSVIGVNATIDNPPPFIKLYNLHGSTNFTFTLNYKLSN